MYININNVCVYIYSGTKLGRVKLMSPQIKKKYGYIILGESTISRPLHLSCSV